MKIDKKLIEIALSLHKSLTNEVAKSTSAEQLKAALGDFHELILDGVMKVRSVEAPSPKHAKAGQTAQK